MASVQVDWVAIENHATRAVERAKKAVAFTQNQLDGFVQAKMHASAKKAHARLMRQKQHLDEAERVLQEILNRPRR